MIFNQSKTFLSSVLLPVLTVGVVFGLFTAHVSWAEPPCVWVSVTDTTVTGGERRELQFEKKKKTTTINLTCVPPESVHEGTTIYVNIKSLKPTQVVVGLGNVKSNADFRLKDVRGLDPGGKETFGLLGDGTQGAKWKGLQNYVAGGESPGFVDQEGSVRILDGHHRATIGALADETYHSSEPLLVPIVVKKSFYQQRPAAAQLGPPPVVGAGARSVRDLIQFHQAEQDRMGKMPRAQKGEIQVGSDADFIKYLCGENKTYFDPKTRQELREALLDTFKALEHVPSESDLGRIFAKPEFAVKQVVSIMKAAFNDKIPQHFSDFLQEDGKHNDRMRALVGKAFEIAVIDPKWVSGGAGIDADVMGDYMQLYLGEALLAEGQFQLPKVVNFVRPVSTQVGKKMTPAEQESFKSYHETMLATASVKRLLLESAQMREFMKASYRKVPGSSQSEKCKHGDPKVEIDCSVLLKEQIKSAKAKMDENKKKTLGELTAEIATELKKTIAEIQPVVASLSAKKLDMWPGGCRRDARLHQRLLRVQSCTTCQASASPRSESSGITAAAEVVAVIRAAHEEELRTSRTSAETRLNALMSGIGFPKMACLFPYPDQEKLFADQQLPPQLAAGSTVLGRSPSSEDLAEAVEKVDEELSWSTDELDVFEKAVALGFMPPCTN